jgi:hypothetical protein
LCQLDYFVSTRYGKNDPTLLNPVICPLLSEVNLLNSIEKYPQLVSII